MFGSKAVRSAGTILSLVSAMLGSRPAIAAEDYRHAGYDETRRGGFAGAVFRIEMGAAAKAPATRLQIGLRSVSSGRQSERMPSAAQVPLFELGAGGRDSGKFFIAGQPAAELKQRLGANGNVGTTVAVAFGVVLLAVGVLVITNLNDLDNGSSD
jgi:hypothetical protein